MHCVSVSSDLLDLRVPIPVDLLVSEDHHHCYCDQICSASVIQLEWLSVPHRHLLRRLERGYPVAHWRCRKGGALRVMGKVVSNSSN